MTQVENSISQSVELNQEEAIQIENLINVLVDLKIIDPSKNDQKADCLTQSTELPSLEPIQLKAYLESKWVYSQPISTSFETYEELEIFSEVNASVEEILDKPHSDNSEDSFAAFQKLQEMLVGPELAELNNVVANIQENFCKLEHQIYDPQELINLLLPSISELLRLKIVESKEEIAQVIAPILDRAILSRIEEDKTSMGTALASAVPIAITEQIRVAPEEISEAFAPTMGRAIKKQIEIEKDTVVDALYPIIGSTISKYMAETIRAINQQVEDTLSVKGITRKFRAKLQGVSEAELILKEALPFVVQAIFLIHKASGLVISEIQRSDAQRLESEMVAGMLTAIRSFANDCITQSGNVSELDAIDYGTSKIILEVAGYCYLAIVVQGEPSKEFIQEMRKNFGILVKDNGQLIEQFDGDPTTIPSQFDTTLKALIDEDSQGKKKKNQPSPLLLLSFTIISAIFIPWGIWQYHNGAIRSIENKTAIALASAPELSVYRLSAEVNKGKLKLTGRVPNQILRAKAEQITKAIAPKWSVENQIISVEVPADPVLSEAEVQRVTEVLNQMDGTQISSQYIAGKVSVEGTVNRIADVQTVQNAFEQIPGVNSISSALRIQPLRIEVRFYFEADSATLVPKDLENKVQQVKLFLVNRPMKHLKIFGYSYSNTNAIEAQKLALARAKAVQQALINQGIEPSRLQIVIRTNLPPGIDITQSEWLKRCVTLEVTDQ
ncbi:MAG: BON domain-containing protein [Cyanomargarita calcarea GSE-NOS-MK-12-04C]|jgi:outer membrane protein OmpA-like peptidoglycan-associated protein|uniref:BON domain-containing protein n=1 Tax=Cyanomargarita calcarea GSE-NOS-MK-12-04C TaxID=2839659 RepID=A0A951QUV1_9CYAN|nr:BON domain-containing protein [Cyanomargarita calcarea GSE-NOS-MK-12-04C]